MAGKETVDSKQMAKHLLTISQHIAKGLKADAAKAAREAKSGKK